MTNILYESIIFLPKKEVLIKKKHLREAQLSCNTNRKQTHYCVHFNTCLCSPLVNIIDIYNKYLYLLSEGSLLLNGLQVFAKETYPACLCTVENWQQHILRWGTDGVLFYQRPVVRGGVFHSYSLFWVLCDSFILSNSYIYV